MNALLLGSPAQRLRLISGLILFAFALTHFLNTATGLISLEAMSTVQDWRIAVTRSVAGSIILGLALITHAGLALVKVAGRSSLRLRSWEWMQLLLGLAIPFFLLPHIINTRGVWTFLGVQDTYAYELARLWPGSALNQSLLMLLVWVHGCIGLHFWLRLTTWYGRVAPLLLVGAVLVPVLALSGFMVQGRQMMEVTSDPASFAALKAQTNWPDAAAEAAVAEWRTRMRIGFYAVLALALLVLAARMIIRRTRRSIAVQYLAGPLVHVAPGPTLLEISRANGIPHLSVCGGRARCSTCRVRVVEGLHDLTPPTETELATLRMIKADADVRLACQARPRGELTVLRLLTAQRHPNMSEAARDTAGVERNFAVLFVDIRGFTRLSEEKLAYDVVFILNRVFHVIGSSIEKSGGRIEKFIGDGLLALFEGESGMEQAAGRALLAAAEIDRALDQLNADLANELKAPLQVAMGLHAGPLVVGKIGWGPAAAVTVIGPTVNVASRLESVAKSENVQLAFSSAVSRAARVNVSGLPVRSFSVKGVSEPVDVVLVAEARGMGLRVGGSYAA